MAKKHPGKAANDNAPPSGRRVWNRLPRNMPITDFELTLIETYFGAMIAEMLNAAANDNAPKVEPGPGRRSEP
jgi:hypothetical protein